MTFKTLLAKSKPRPGQSEWPGTYIGHITAVMRAARTLNEELAPRILEVLGLKASELKKFMATVLLAAYLHDWGKANEHFQIMVRLKALEKCDDDNERRQQRSLQEKWDAIGKRQMVRHEILSGVLAYSVPEFRSWLEQCPDADFHAAVWAAIGHHLKVGGQTGKETNRIAELRDGTGLELPIYVSHENFTNLLKYGVRELGLPEVYPQRPRDVWTRGELGLTLQRMRESFIIYEERLTDEQQRFLAAVKATVLAADIAGSALPAAGKNIETWIRSALQLVLSDTDIQAVLATKLNGVPLRPFQKCIADTPHRVTLVRAGCGTGKTIAAYAWSERFGVGRKLFFCYPTTGTSSQGYFDYAAATDVETTLMHSRAAIDLEEVLFTGEDQHEPEDGKDAETINARLSSFGAWQSKIAVCTVDSVLGLIQNNRTPLYSWPAIVQSAFVFDEVHAYGDRLFGALLRFLQTFRGAPMLLMSASFSDGQIAAIAEVVEHQQGERLEVVPGPENLEILERYDIHQLEDADTAWKPVLRALEKGGKVLWVTNTVADCISLYRQASERTRGIGITPLIYHSRFRYQDRVKKHRAVVNAFRGNEAVLAVTTQVCEMSLDLSADILVTALSPAAALIQRFGRLNRKVIEETSGVVRVASGNICPAYVYPWTKPFPYDEVELATGSRLLELLPAGAIRQSDLAEAAAQLGSNQPESVTSNWLDKNWRSFPAPTREAGHTLTVLLEDDIPAIRRAISKTNPISREAQRWTVPIPLLDSVHRWRREGFFPIAPKLEVTYSEETGAELCKTNKDAKSHSTWAIL